jgi:hypothetical protein
MVFSTASGAGDEIPDDALILKVGDSVTVAFTQSGDTLLSPTIEAAPEEGRPVVVLELTESGRARSFRIWNGYGRVLHYRAATRMRGRKRHFDVPVSAVSPGVRSTVILNDPFDELVLFEFFLSDSR